MQRLINEIVERAKANRQRIVLPEGTEERTLKAANQILTDGVADLIILGKPAEIEACAKEWGLGNINKATIIDPEDHPKKEEYAQLLCELRKKKGMTIEEARKLVVDPLYLGCLIIKNGDADGQLAGARNTTGKDNVFWNSEQSGFYRRRLRTGRTGHPARVLRFSGRAGRRCRENVSFPCRAASRNGPDEGRSRRICRRHGAIRPSGRLFFAIVFYFCISERFLSVGMQRVRTIRSRNSD